MNELVSKIAQIEEETSAEKGDYELFALFLRENSADKWDVLAAASWIYDDKKHALPYLAKKIQQSLTPAELVQIARIVLIDADNPALLDFQNAIEIKHSTVEINNSTFNGVPIKRAYIITSGRPQPV